MIRAMSIEYQHAADRFNSARQFVGHMTFCRVLLGIIGMVIDSFSATGHSCDDIEGYFSNSILGRREVGITMLNLTASKRVSL